MSLLDRLRARLPYRLSTWVAHVRDLAGHRRKRREVVPVEEEIRRALPAGVDAADRPAEADGGDEPGPHFRYTLRDFDRLGCVFVHVPKAAGISVATALFGHLAGGHRTVEEYRRIFGWDFDRYFVFTVVRNPFARLVSAYNYLLGEHPVFWLNARYRDRVLERYRGFDEFVLRELETAAGDNLHFRPQTHFLCADGELDVDYVATVETLEEDFRHVCDRLDVDASLPHRNASDAPERNLTEYFSDPEVADVVRSVYARDFELLPYGRDVPDRAV